MEWTTKEKIQYLIDLKTVLKERHSSKKELYLCIYSKSVSYAPHLHIDTKLNHLPFLFNYKYINVFVHPFNVFPEFQKRLSKINIKRYGFSCTACWDGYDYKSRLAFINRFIKQLEEQL